jgi:hypothetical protein
MRVLHVADSCIDLAGHAAAPASARERDIRAGFERAVQAAIDHRADVFLHAGGLFAVDGDCDGRYPASWFESCLSRLHAADIAPVVHETGFQLYGASCEILPAGGSLEVGGWQFVSGMDRAIPGRSVRCLWGRTPGIPSTRGDANPPSLDASQVAQLSDSYVAMAGTRRMQLVQPNAAYSGVSAPVDRYCTGAPVALLADLGEHTAQMRSLTAVRLPNRRVVDLQIDGSGMGAEMLGSTIHTRVEQALVEHAAWRDSVGRRLEARHEDPELIRRINELYGRADHGRQCSWVPVRPVVRICVTNALCSRSEAWQAEPRLAWLEEQQLVATLEIEFDGQRETVPLA